jgi:hypothetical protein
MHIGKFCYKLQLEEFVFLFPEGFIPLSPLRNMDSSIEFRKGQLQNADNGTAPQLYCISGDPDEHRSPICKQNKWRL